MVETYVENVIRWLKKGGQKIKRWKKC